MTTPFNSLAKIVAGTYIAESDGKAKNNPVIAWVQKELRVGSLQPAVEAFAKEQQEFLDPALVLVEAVTANEIECLIPCKQFDHESTGTFMAEVRFKVNPTSGQAVRELSA